jgi:hypothetical protein
MPVNYFIFEFDNRKGTPLDFSPPASQKPTSHLTYQNFHILWIRLHDLVKLGKFSRSKENLCQSKLKIQVVESESFEQSFAEQPWIQSDEILREKTFVHVVQTGELTAT